VDTRPDDPFGTEALRRRVLAGWEAAPARFREDANAEEDLVHGAYRDRLLIELAQNAADAAGRAGDPGVLRLSIVDGELRAANTGAPLDAAGVEALATLRASAKRDADTVGRFGVGFAAVLAVSDAPVLVSTTGGVRFSAADTRAEVERLPSLADELRRRDGQVPVLRLPWSATGAPPPGFATEVRLPLRPAAEPVVRSALADLDATVLLALPGLSRIELPDRTLIREPAGAGVVVLRDGDRARRWWVRSASGTVPADLLAQRPVEERERAGWSVRWAVPIDRGGTPQPLPGRGVVHAPTPSDEPVSLPARLLATFPLGPDRRHVAPGPITDLLVKHGAAAYAALVAELPPTPDLLALVPRPTLAAAPLDAALCRAALAALRETTWLPTAAGAEDVGAGDAAEMGGMTVAGVLLRPGGATKPGDAVETSGGVPLADGADADGDATATSVARRVAPGEAVVVDAAGDGLVAALRAVLPGLLPAEWSRRHDAPALNALGVRRLSTADVVELVSGLDRPARWWRALYAGLADVPDREALGAIRVPLADGRLVTGARGLLLPEPGLPVEAAAAVAALGLRVVHPDAVHPLLERLGAVPASPRALLADDRVRAAVEASYHDEDPESVAEAVLALVTTAGVEPGELPWLGELALPGADGDWYPATELLLPGSALAEVIRPDAPFGVVPVAWVERWGADALRAVGVLETFAVLRVTEAEIEPRLAEHDLDGEADWYEAVLDRLPPQPVPPRLDELVAVRDLDLVRADAWHLALPMVAALRGVIDRSTVVLADGRRVLVPSYTRWWLATHPVLEGRRPDRLRLASATDLDGLYDVASGDRDLLELAGCLAGLPDVLDDVDRAAELLHRLGDPGRTVPAATLRDVHPRLAFALDGYEADVPGTVRIAPDRVVAREQAVVLDAPYLLPLLGGRAAVPSADAPGPVADLLGLPFASELSGLDSDPSAVDDEAGARRLRWADVPGAALAAERCGASLPDGEVAVHVRLTVAGGVAVPWWPGGAGLDHVDAAAGAAALGRALAWRLGRWEARTAAAEAFARPVDADALRAEDTLR
jgi:hypothetical protein